MKNSVCEVSVTSLQRYKCIKEEKRKVTGIPFFASLCLGHLYFYGIQQVPENILCLVIIKNVYVDCHLLFQTNKFNSIIFPLYFGSRNFSND